MPRFLLHSMYTFPMLTATWVKQYYQVNRRAKSWAQRRLTTSSLYKSWSIDQKVKQLQNNNRTVWETGKVSFSYVLALLFSFLSHKLYKVEQTSSFFSESTWNIQNISWTNYFGKSQISLAARIPDIWWRWWQWQQRQWQWHSLHLLNAYCMPYTVLNAL